MKNRKGMTLVEVVVAIGLFGIIMVTIFPAFLILNLTNIVSYENTDANYVAQDVLERITNSAQTSSYEDTTDMLVSVYGYTFNSGLSSTDIDVYTFSDDEYTINITFSLDQPTEGLTTVLVVVVANRNIEGQRAQLETIVNF